MGPLGGAENGDGLVGDPLTPLRIGATLRSVSAPTAPLDPSVPGVDR